ncbi:hypothetical protein ACEUAM_22855, partial [Aeromonas hydrophila]|uniref:hypothetical protein n=1 Tax=Aeromonas hydrophila TaxID=644 RepID=UPI0038D211BD
YSANDGWNTYIYWVSTTQQTGPDPMRICARVGTYGQNGEGYYDSCANGRNESANVRSQAPKHYWAADYYQTSRLQQGPSDHYQKYFVSSVGLRGGKIHSAQVATPPVSGARASCVGTFGKSRDSRPSYQNVSLILMPFGQTSADVVEMYTAKHGRYDKPFPQTGLDGGKINLVESHGSLYDNVGSRYYGYWSVCGDYTDGTQPTVSAPGAISFIDSYGNDGRITFRIDEKEWQFSMQ